MRRLALLMTAILAACSTSSVSYVSNKEVGAYFTVPKEWFSVSQKALDKSEFEAIASVTAQQRYDLVRWQTAWAPSRIKASDVLATQPQSFPVAYVRVRDLSNQERNTVSLNSLRDLVFPVTSATAPVTIESDREISQGKFTGVDLTYDITIDGIAQSLRQVALLAPDRSRVYLFVLRCSRTCFQSKSDQINTIADTFTVRGTSG